MALITRVPFPGISNDADTSSVEVLWAISVAGILSWL